MMRRRLRHKAKQNQHTERWLVSYADYMTIMFAFFLVMYAIAINKEDRFQVLSDSLGQVFDKSARTQQQVGSGVNGSGILTKQRPPKDDILYGESINQIDQGSTLLAGQSETSNIDKKHLGKPLGSLLTKLQTALIDEIRNAEANLELNQDWLIIELSSGMLFSSGSATTQQQAKHVVEMVSDIIAPVDNFIRVRGYTDDESIDNEIFSSNWELSVARATSVLVELEEFGINPARMAIEGYGQYSPLAKNNTAAGRAKNRKVVIALSKFAYVAEPEQVQNSTPNHSQVEQSQEVELANDDHTIKVIQLPHGGIRITTRNAQ